MEGNNALVLAKKSSDMVPSSTEEDDLLLRSSKKIKNVDAWPKLGETKQSPWSAGPSFAQMLQGINSSGKDDAEGMKDMSDDSISDSETEDSVPLCEIREDPDRNFPSFLFSAKMKKRLYKAWNQAVIVKLLGKSIGYKLLLSILQKLWAKRGVISLINIGNGYFVVKLTNKEDYRNALTGGPWMLFDHYLTVRPWEPNFKPWQTTIDKVAVWIRMHKVSLEYYNREALTWIGDRIGDIIKVDINTSCQLRGHYARICVLVDLGKQLMSGFNLDGDDYGIEYEGLHGLCINCGIYGHKVGECKTGVPKGKTERANPVNIMAEGSASPSFKQPENISKFDQDTWTVVNKPRRTKKGSKEKPITLRPPSSGSRYDVLASSVQGNVEGANLEEGKKPVEVCGTALTVFVGEPSILPQKSKAAKKGDHKKSVPGVSDIPSRQDLRKEKRTRDMRRKEAVNSEVIVVENPCVELKVDISSQENLYEVMVTGPSGPVDSKLAIPLNEAQFINEAQFSSLPHDPGDPSQSIGPVGKFWADPNSNNPDCDMIEEIVEETPCKYLLPVGDPDSHTGL